MFKIRVSYKFCVISFVIYFISMHLANALPEYRFSHLDSSPNPEINYFFEKDCECVKLRDCKTMITLAIKSQSSEKVYIYDKIRKASCGFDDNHPLVCCPSSDENNYSPHEFEEEDEDEKPWIWDTTKLNNNKYFLENSKKKKIIPKFNYGFEEFPGYEQNLVDFEDPHTRKNCPPSFEDGFEDEININSRRKQFKPIIDPHGYDSFDALYGYPAPSGFKFSKLDPTVEPPVTKRIEIDYKSKQLNSEYCGLSVNTRIVGGKDSGPGQFPWIARVGYKNKSK
ncbi:uncharacterized protein LOC129939827 [Eupeodes corollae]|uniref:uncharacterized protein LOC129939827 n=1 Tax=Eupeodes corollae TaxID=290404 RepID=UPI0024916670|nr:uncharacterized protein LOC129939827 [Eupeodes corollae]